MEEEQIQIGKETVSPQPQQPMSIRKKEGSSQNSLAPWMKTQAKNIKQFWLSANKNSKKTPTKKEWLYSYKK